ncbi:MAG TPA: hypothetical protein VJZ26_02505 [Blastocatellia bacterium]|nr:hypothetical protein [Blastocatellia bacterium]
MRRILDNWPRLAYIYLPLLMVSANAAILLNEHLQPDTEKAIRLVRESNSRKENFTVQQYLYSTVFYRKSRGEAIEIDGWRAVRSGADGPITVEFGYRDAGGHHVAVWEASVKENRVSAANDSARNLSWH